MDRLITVDHNHEVPEKYKNTPIEKLVTYHNLDYAHGDYETAELLIGMCMDHRKKLNIPEKWAYIIRSGGGNLRFSEFKVSFAIGVGGVQNLALIGHTQCGMVNLVSKKELFINGLVKNGGWEKEKAEEQFTQFAPLFEIGNEIDFVLAEAQRLRLKYPKILIAPLLYRVEDNKLYFVRED